MGIVNGNSNKEEDEDLKKSAQESSKNESDERRDKKYEDLRKEYEEFVDTMLLPESAVAVQGMKNFVRQFDTAFDIVNNTSGDSDEMLRNMKITISNHIRSSHESLVTGSGSSTISSSSRGGNNSTHGGQPDWDRRSLESFLYGQIKEVLDKTLDWIIEGGEGNTEGGKSGSTSLQPCAPKGPAD